MNKTEKIVVSVLVVGFIGTLGYNRKYAPEAEEVYTGNIIENTGAYSSQSMNYGLPDSDRIAIARAATAAMFDRTLSIITGVMDDEGIVRTSYIRPSDSTRWVTDFKFDGNTIVWADVDSGQRRRWRDAAQDERITYIMGDNSITIIQTWPNGQEIRKTITVE